MLEPDAFLIVLLLLAVTFLIVTRKLLLVPSTRLSARITDEDLQKLLSEKYYS